MPPKLGGPAMATKRIKKEISDLSKEDLGSIILQPNESNILNWKAFLPGPIGSPYEGGLFEVDIKVPDDYPFSPPQLHFVTKVYHCNIASSGAICLDLLKNAWSPALSLYKVILSLSSLLTDPNPSDPLVAPIAQEYKRDRKKHDATARQWTKQYATPKTAPPAPVIPPPQPKASSSSRPKAISRPSSSSIVPVQIAGTRRPASSRDPIDLVDNSDSEEEISVSVLTNSSRPKIINGSSIASNDQSNSTRKRIKLNGHPTTHHPGGGGGGGGGGGSSAGDAIVID
ncbi:uncharacterized protein L201_003680 [Kwoniella dendrophila CBS 6074]|uniref:UBC core domain-containing protein n=1 Tax=Kwoniella dendrophila CBS 6074 TaxID=1295534 RepID=A0AAX4JW10_9TREE